MGASDLRLPTSDVPLASLLTVSSHRRYHRGDTTEGPLLPTSIFQFERTRPLRLAAYRRAELARRGRVVEVGAGECVVAAEVAARTGRSVWSVDPRLPSAVPEGVWALRGDARHLPFADGSLDAVLFHFVLLWLPDPVGALREARRVLAEDGVLLLLAEPDLTARRDEPDTGLGRALADAVRKAGGHPDAGGHLEEWLKTAGFRAEVQRTPEEWVGIPDPAECLHEVEALRGAGHLTTEAAAAMTAAERAATDNRRVLLPIRWAVGWRSQSRDESRGARPPRRPRP